MTRVVLELQAILAGALRQAAAWRLRILAGVAAASVITVWLLPRDAAVLRAVRAAGSGWMGLAESISRVGRFENSSLAFAMVAAAVGLLLDSRRWKDVAVACLLAGTVAGIGVNVLRPSFGRARPHAQVEPGFYWFETRADLNSMPSGHAMSNAASAFAIVPLVPAALVPAVVYTVAMSWSRMQLNQHYPSDVLWGSLLGVIVGLTVGASIRDRRRQARSRSSGRS